MSVAAPVRSRWKDVSFLTDVKPEEHHMQCVDMWCICPIRHRGAGALPAASGDSPPTAAGGEAAEPRHHACAERSQPHTGENTHSHPRLSKSSETLKDG